MTDYPAQFPLPSFPARSGDPAEPQPDQSADAIEPAEEVQPDFFPGRDATEPNPEFWTGNAPPVETEADDDVPPPPVEPAADDPGFVEAQMSGGDPLSDSPFIGPDNSWMGIQNNVAPQGTVSDVMPNLEAPNDQTLLAQVMQRLEAIDAKLNQLINQPTDNSYKLFSDVS